MFDGRNLFDQQIKNDFKTFDNIRVISMGQGDDYTVGCLLDYLYFKKYYKLIKINLSKQKKLEADPKAIQQIKLTRNLDSRRFNNFFYYCRSKSDSFQIFQKEQLKYYDFISF